MSKQRLPKGNDFMPDVTIETIRKMRKKEKNANASLRLQASFFRKKGYSLRKIGDILDTSFGTVADWLRRMHKMGLEGRYHSPRPGAECKLNHIQLDELMQDLIAGPSNCGFESGMWTAPLVIAHVRNKYHIEYKVSGMLCLLHRMGFSWRKARPRHPKAPDEEEIKEFKKSWTLNSQIP